MNINQKSSEAAYLDLRSKYKSAKPCSFIGNLKSSEAAYLDLRSKYKSSKYKLSKSFTLIELLVAMGVFTLLTLLLMNFFGTANKAWLHMRQHSEVYANARMALDIISRDIQSITYDDGQLNYPFWHEAPDRINFIATPQLMPHEEYTSIFAEIRYNLKDGWIMRSVTPNVDSSGNPNPKWNFGDYPLDLLSEYNNYRAYCIWVKYHDPKQVPPPAAPPDDTHYDMDSFDAFQKLVPYVTNLTFTCLDADGYDMSVGDGVVGGIEDYVNDMNITWSGDYNGDGNDDDTYSDNPKLTPLPNSILIEMRILDSENWAKYEGLTAVGNTTRADEILAENERTFSKLVFIGERNDE